MAKTKKLIIEFLIVVDDADMATALREIARYIEFQGLPGCMMTVREPFGRRELATVEQEESDD